VSLGTVTNELDQQGLGIALDGPSHLRHMSWSSTRATRCWSVSEPSTCSPVTSIRGPRTSRRSSSRPCRREARSCRPAITRTRRTAKCPCP